MATLEANLNEKKVRMAAASDSVKRMANTVENAKAVCILALFLLYLFSCVLSNIIVIHFY